MIIKKLETISVSQLNDAYSMIINHLTSNKTKEVFTNSEVEHATIVIPVLFGDTNKHLTIFDDNMYGYV